MISNAFVRAIDGSPVPLHIETECGTATFDISSGISYRCDHCFAVIGSIGMPGECKELYDMVDVVKKLKGK